MRVSSLIRIAITLLFFTMTNSVWSYEVFVVATGEMIESETIPTCKRSVERIEDSYKITYRFDSLMVVQDEEVLGTKYFIIPGFSSSQEEESAAVPGKIERFAFDSNIGANLLNVSYSYEDYPFSYTPARAPQINSDTDNVSVRPIKYSNGFYPDVPIRQFDNEVYRGRTVSNVGIFPVAYDSSRRIIRIYNEVSYILVESEFDNDSSDWRTFNVSENDYNWINDIYHLGNNFQTENKITIPNDRHYLILCTPDLLDASKQFKNWKTKIGYTVSIECKSVWTQEDVAGVIRDCAENTPNLYYVILMGDTEHIPTNVSRSVIDKNHFDTDIPYVCLDGLNDFYPDLYVGRLPASTIDEATNLVNKIVAYEKDPSDGGKIPVAAFAAHFQTSSSLSTVEQRGFVYTSETVASYLTGKYGKVKRIYSSDTKNPQSWSQIYGNGKSISSYLNPSVFEWNGDSIQIINAFNAGCSLFVHRDHGALDSWFKPKLSISALPKLSNTMFPIVLSINCLTGNFSSQDRFARKLVNLKNAGAVTAVAATEVSITNYNDVFLVGMIDAAFPYPGLVYEPNLSPIWKSNGNIKVESIGEMMLSGHNRVRETFAAYNTSGLNSAVKGHIEEYHCLGDPGLLLFSECSNVLENNARVNRSHGLMEINLGSIRANVGLYNEVTGESKRFTGSIISYDCNDSDNVQVYVSKSGCKPYIFTSLGTESLGGLKSGFIKSVYSNGNGVTVVLDVNKLTSISENELKLYFGTISNPLLIYKNVISDKDTYSFVRNLGSIGGPNDRNPNIVCISLITNDGDVVETVKAVIK